MQKVFDAEYYSHDVDKNKPVFTDDEDDGLFRIIYAWYHRTFSFLVAVLISVVYLC